MKKVRNLTLALLLALCALPAFAQPYGVRITIDSAQALPDTLYIGSQYNFRVFLHNDSVTTFNDTVFLFYRIDTVNYVGPNGSSGLEYPLIASDSILPNDSVAVNIVAHVTSPAFKAGPSVVVIWPIAAHHNLVFDTAVKSVTVVDLGNGIEEPGADNLQMLVTGNNLHFIRGTDLPLNYVRLFNASGQLLLQANNASDDMQLPPLPPGVYFVEAMFDNKHHLFRFVKP